MLFFNYCKYNYLIILYLLIVQIKIKHFFVFFIKVSPTELENLISQLKGVADVAVVGIPDVLSGEIPRAFVVKRPGMDIDEKTILSHVEKNVVAYKKLAGGVKFLDMIPRNPSGKVLRNELKVFGNNPSEQPQN